MVDALDLGSSAQSVRVRIPCPVPVLNSCLKKIVEIIKLKHHHKERKKMKTDLVVLPQFTTQDSLILSFAPKILSLSKPLPLVKKIKIPSLSRFDEYFRPLDIIKIKKHNGKIK